MTKKTAHGADYSFADFDVRVFSGAVWWGSRFSGTFEHLSTFRIDSRTTSKKIHTFLVVIRVGIEKIYYNTRHDAFLCYRDTD